jgi:hypothetical protein
VKRSGRDEPMWVAIHMCRETMLGISLYSYLYLKLAKLSSVFNKIGEEGKTGSAWKQGVGGERRDSGERRPKQCIHI